jgi:hypothetical protein
MFDIHSLILGAALWSVLVSAVNFFADEIIEADITPQSFGGRVSRNVFSPLFFVTILIASLYGKYVLRSQDRPR